MHIATHLCIDHGPSNLCPDRFHPASHLVFHRNRSKLRCPPHKHRSCQTKFCPEQPQCNPAGAPQAPGSCPPIIYVHMCMSLPVTSHLQADNSRSQRGYWPSTAGFRQVTILCQQGGYHGGLAFHEEHTLHTSSMIRAKLARSHRPSLLGNARNIPFSRFIIPCNTCSCFSRLRWSGFVKLFEVLCLLLGYREPQNSLWLVLSKSRTRSKITKLKTGMLCAHVEAIHVTQESRGVNILEDIASNQTNL